MANPIKRCTCKPGLPVIGRYGLETDTVSYFLTVNPSGGNLRYTAAVEQHGGHNVAVCRSVFHAPGSEVNYRQQVNKGYAAVIGEYVVSSAWRYQEGWSSNDTILVVRNRWCCRMGYAAGRPTALPLPPRWRR